ncbi:hypothetical protein D9M72_505810 [compost metagenome]
MRVPIKPCTSTLLREDLHRLDQQFPGSAAPNSGRNIEVFEIANIGCRPCGAVQDRIHEADQAITLCGDGREHRLVGIQESIEGGARDFCGQLHFVEGLVVQPELAPCFVVVFFDGPCKRRRLIAIHLILRF